MFAAFHRRKLESLEDRNLLAADASISVSGGSLFVHGSSESDNVEIRAEADAGTYTVSGIEVGDLEDVSSRFSGDVRLNADGSVTVSGVERGMHVALGDGDDRLMLDQVDLNGNLRISMGAGNDQVLLADGEIAVASTDDGISTPADNSLNGDAFTNPDTSTPTDDDLTGADSITDNLVDDVAGDDNSGDDNSDVIVEVPTDDGVTDATDPRTLEPSVDHDNSRAGVIARLLDNIENRTGRFDRFFDRVYDRFQDADVDMGQLDNDRLQQVFGRIGVPEFLADNFDPDQIRNVLDRLNVSGDDLANVGQSVRQVVANFRNNLPKNNDDGADSGDDTADAAIAVDGQLRIDTGDGNDMVTINSVGDDKVSLTGASVDHLMASLGAGADMLDVTDVRVDRVTRLVGGSGDDTFNDVSGNGLSRLKQRSFELLTASV